MKRGFTLIELLVAITIVAVLTTVGLTTYQGTQGAARDSVRKNDLNKLATALELYLQKNGKYPHPLPQTGDENCTRDTANFYASIDDFIEGQVPKDPKTKAEYCYIAPEEGRGFRLFAKLENCSNSPNTFCSDDNDDYNYTVVSDNLLIASLTTTPSSPSPSPSSSPTSSPTSSPSPSPSPSSSPSPTASPTPSSTPTVAYKRVFVTSGRYSGNLKSEGSGIGLGTANTGVDGASKICQSSADNPDNNTATNDALGGTWKAWISDSTRSPANQSDGDVWTQFNGEYRLVDGITKVVDRWSDLVTGASSPTTNILSSAIKKNERGEEQADFPVWTGTNSSGQLYLNTFSCLDWTDRNANNFGITGSSGRTNYNWTISNDNKCEGQWRLYCFEQ